MYAFLKDRVGKKWALILTILWYFLLLNAIILFSDHDQARFNYLGW